MRGMLTSADTNLAMYYRVAGMDCASCANKIEAAARAVRGVRSARVSLVAQELTVDAAPEALPELERTVNDLGYGLCRHGEQPHHAPTYRRALWLVVALNLGYGICEIFGALLADSQALLADALDFVGDGSITLLGLLAIGWPRVWRGRAALLQGIFLGALGVGVLVTTAYRVLILNGPAAELMGFVGLGALAVNVVAALLLMPHRTGDANVRAVWLFSRNDAIGNVAVVAAAVLVALTQTPWPDLAVAAGIATLFLHSAWAIIIDARRELREDARA